MPFALLQRCPLLQGLQNKPLAPQVLTSSDAYLMHWPFLQQPFGHDVESQTQEPPEQRCPFAHAVHTRPDEPHTVSWLPVTQVPLEQQPLQVTDPQVQAPF
jgi:hypothetical protein